MKVLSFPLVSNIKNHKFKIGDRVKIAKEYLNTYKKKPNDKILNKIFLKKGTIVKLPSNYAIVIKWDNEVALTRLHHTYVEKIK